VGLQKYSYPCAVNTGTIFFLVSSSELTSTSISMMGFADKPGMEVLPKCSILLIISDGRQEVR